jgi:hypothetical protein
VVMKKGLGGLWKGTMRQNGKKDGKIEKRGAFALNGRLPWLEVDLEKDQYMASQNETVDGRGGRGEEIASTCDGGPCRKIDMSLLRYLVKSS